VSWLPYLSLAVSLCVLIVSIVTANRAGSWRNSDELREIDKRQSHVEGRLSVVEKQIDTEFTHLRSLVDRLDTAVSRMESFFMRPPQ
jgi:flagellar capping protein FliD